MALDGFKIQLPKEFDPTTWVNHSLLNFKVIGHISNDYDLLIQEAQYKGLIFQIRETKNQAPFICTVRGCLPKYLKGENYNNLNIEDLNNAIQQLKDQFAISPTSTLLKAEFGTNIALTTHKAKDVVNGLFFYKKGYDFINYQERGKRLGSYIEKQNYRIKIYDKGKQSQIKREDLLRLEVVLKSKQLKKMNINTLSDALKKSNIIQARDMILDHLKEIIILDPNPKPNQDLDPNQLLKYYQYKDLYWQNLSGNKLKRYKDSSMPC